MFPKGIKSLLAAVFSIIFLFSSYNLKAQHEEDETPAAHEAEGKEQFNAKEVIFGHIMDAHDFHFAEYKGSDGKKHPISIPLPVILYSPQKGLSVFMSSKFEHGHQEVDGYKLNAEG